MVSTSKKPALFDSHLHIIDPQFPLYKNQGYLPSPFTINDYLASLDTVDLRGGAIVSGSFQGFDQSYLLHALNELGPDFVGVTQLPADTSDKDILELHGAGVRAVRFNLKRGGSESVSQLLVLADRIHELAHWHVELYLDGSEIAGLAANIIRLPSVCIDHMGLSKEGFTDLLKLVEQGVKVKASGFGRLDFDPLPALKRIYDINSNALMFGSDLPSTRAPRAFSNADIALIIENFDSTAAHNILYQNAYDFYFRRNVFYCC